jgi:hypothetical protein
MQIHTLAFIQYAGSKPRAFATPQGDQLLALLPGDFVPEAVIVAVIGSAQGTA